MMMMMMNFGVRQHSICKLGGLAVPGIKEGRRPNVKTSWVSVDHDDDDHDHDEDHDDDDDHDDDNDGDDNVMIMMHTHAQYLLTRLYH